MAKYLYLISYILDNQPGSCEFRSDEENLSREAAREYLQGLHATKRPLSRTYKCSGRSTIMNRALRPAIINSLE